MCWADVRDFTLTSPESTWMGRRGWIYPEKRARWMHLPRKITLDYCDLRIIPSDEFAIEGAGRQKGQAGDPGEGRRTAFEGEGGKGCGSAFYVLGFSDLEESYLNLYVPEEAVLAGVDIDSDAGDVHAESLEAESLHIRAAYGDVELQEVKQTVWKCTWRPEIWKRRIFWLQEWTPGMRMGMWSCRFWKRPMNTAWI